MSGWDQHPSSQVLDAVSTPFDRGAVGGNCRYPAISNLPPDSTRATLPSLAPTSTPRPADCEQSHRHRSISNISRLVILLAVETERRQLLQYSRITRRVSFFSDRSLFPRSILSAPAAATVRDDDGMVAILITFHGLSCPERWTAHGARRLRMQPETNSPLHVCCYSASGDTNLI